MNPRLAALWLLLIAFTFTGCTTYTTKTETLAVSLSPRIKSGKILLTATMVNKGNSSVTLVNHPYSYLFEIEPVGGRDGKGVLGGCILYEPVGRDDFVRLRPGQSLTFEWPYPFNRRSDGTLDIFHPAIGKEYPLISTRQPLLEGRFTYIGRRSLPLFARFGLANFLVGEAGAEVTFRAP